MDLRFDFGDKIDFVKVNNKIQYLLINNSKNNIELYFKDYKVSIETLKDDEYNSYYKIIIILTDIYRDDSGSIIRISDIYPLMDTRFKDSKIIKDLFEEPEKYTHFSNKAILHSYNYLQIMQSIIDFIKLVHKINHLKVFL